MLRCLWGPADEGEGEASWDLALGRQSSQPPEGEQPFLSSSQLSSWENTPRVAKSLKFSGQARDLYFLTWNLISRIGSNISNNALAKCLWPSGGPSCLHLCISALLPQYLESLRAGTKKLFSNSIPWQDWTPPFYTDAPRAPPLCLHSCCIFLQDIILPVLIIHILFGFQGQAEWLSPMGPFQTNRIPFSFERPKHVLCTSLRGLITCGPFQCFPFLLLAWWR